MYVPEPSIPMARPAAAAETVEETVEETAAAAAAAAVGDMARGHRCMYQVDPRANLFSWSKKCTCRSRHDGSPGFVSATCSLPAGARAATRIRQSSGIPQPSQPSITRRGPGYRYVISGFVISARAPPASVLTASVVVSSSG
jgi:hypothetical protein